jgi:hypothetical protein
VPPATHEVVTYIISRPATRAHGVGRRSTYMRPRLSLNRIVIRELEEEIMKTLQNRTLSNNSFNQTHN